MGQAEADFLVDSSNFQWEDSRSQTQKLGLGSSAAATVAFAAALQHRLAIHEPEFGQALYRIAQDAHHKVQGTGSGADVAASCFGGVLRYRWLHEQRLQSKGPDEIVLDCVAGTGVCAPVQGGPSHILVAWTGKSASTRNLVRAVHEHRNSSAYAEIMESIAASSRSGQQAWTHTDYSALRLAALQGIDALENLSRLAQVELITDEHRRLQSLLKKEHVVVKPTGAGGDLAWLIPSDEQQVDQVLMRLKAANIPAWNMPISRHGARLITND